MNEQEAAERERRGTWWQRFLIWTFSVALALLFYWLLGFVLQDIGNLPGPDWDRAGGGAARSRAADRRPSG